MYYLKAYNPNKKGGNHEQTNIKEWTAAREGITGASNHQDPPMQSIITFNSYIKEWTTTREGIRFGGVYTGQKLGDPWSKMWLVFYPSDSRHCYPKITDKLQKQDPINQ
jgi:hypothetical protein